MKHLVSISLWVFLSLVPVASPQDTPVAIRGATILTGAGSIIDKGTLLFEKGKIVAVGETIPFSEEFDIIEASGLYATPGLIDGYSHLGVDNAGAASDFLRRDALAHGSAQPGLGKREDLMMASRRVIDSLEDFTVYPRDSEWLRSGVTATYVSPGGQTLVGGLGAVVKLTGKIVREESAVSVSFGESVLNTFEAPTTRQGMIGVLRQTLIRASEDTLREEDSRTFAQLLNRELSFRVLANTPDDILTALRLAEEFKLSLVLDSAVGGHKVAEAIARANVPVVVGPAIVGTADGGPYEMFAHTPNNASLLHRAGVLIALSTGRSGKGTSVAMEVAIAKAHGLPQEAALAAVTSDAAKILGVGDRLGTLAPGMDADIVLWAGHPISTWGETTRVIIDGQTVFER